MLSFFKKLSQRVVDKNKASSPLLNRWMYYFIPVCVSILVTFSSVLDWFSSADNFIYDNLLLLKKHQQSSDIVIIGIDQQSIDEFGRWPWPRTLHGELIDRLITADVVFFDVIFAEENHLDTEGDHQLIRSVENHGRVVLPIHMELLRHKGQAIEVPPMPGLYQVAAGVGHVHVACDEKGICRSFYLKEGVAEAYWPHAALAILNTLPPAQRADVLTPIDSMPFVVDEPLTKTAQEDNVSFMSIHRSFEVFFPFFNASDRYQKISFIDVLSGIYPENFFSGKVVFIGATAMGLGDYFSTPHGLISGVALNAIAFDALKNNELIYHETSVWLAVASGAVTFLIALLLGVFSPFYFVVAVVFVLLSLLMLSFLLLNYFNVWVSVAPILLGLIVYYPLWNFFKLHVALTFLKRSLNDFEHGSVDTGFVPVFTSSFHYSKQGLMHGDSVEVVSKTILRLKRAIEQAEFSRQLVSKSLSSLQDAVVILDANLDLVLSNDLARTWFVGLSYNDSLSDDQATNGHESSYSMGNHFVDCFHGENHSIMARSIEDVSGGATVEAFSLVLNKDSVSPRYVLVNINKIELAEAYLPHVREGVDKAFVICVFTDVTAIKAAEQSKLDTLNFLSHDLRSPMVSVLALIDRYLHLQKNQQQKSMGLSNDDLVVTDVSDVFLDIRRYVKKNLSYSESLLQLSRAESLVVDTFGLIDFHAIMDNALYQVSAIAEKRAVTIAFASVEDDIWLYGNTDLVERALVNLLSNAIKYSHDGGHVSCAIQLAEGYVEICISDSGVGMSEAFLTKIFSRFARSGDDPNKQGIGLGLFFVKTVMDKHKGSVEVESHLGKGSCFTVRFPCAQMDELDSINH